MITRTPISQVKSIQRGVSTIPDNSTGLDVAITSVDTSKSMVSFLGYGEANSTGPGIPWVLLAASTTVRLTRIGGAGYTVSRLSWEVIEYE